MCWQKVLCVSKYADAGITHTRLTRIHIFSQDTFRSVTVKWKNKTANKYFVEAPLCVDGTASLLGYVSTTFANLEVETLHILSCERVHIGLF